MKKVLSIIFLILIFLITYFFQVNFFSWFTIDGVMPNLFVILVLYIGLFAGKKVGISLGLVFGLILDLLTSQNVMISAILLGLVALFGGYFQKNFSKESKITIMIMVAGATVFYELGYYLIINLIEKAPIEIIEFLKVLLIEVIYNVILTIILYPLFQKIGHMIEEKFKTAQILTRYF